MQDEKLITIIEYVANLLWFLFQNSLKKKVVHVGHQRLVSAKNCYYNTTKSYVKASQTT